jgi:O-antigen/teichoic acid export membrane protein
VLAFPLLLTNSVLGGALAGREEFLAQNVVRAVTGVVVQVAPLAVAIVVGPALPALVITVTAVRVLNAAVLFWLCSVRLPVGLRPRLVRSEIRPLFSFGGWVTVTGIVGPLLSTLDRVLVGAIAGAKAVTYYSVPFNLASRITVLPGSLSTALFPRFSSMEDAERDLLMDGAVRSLLVVLTPLIVAGMLVMEPFLAWWLGLEFASRASTIGEIFVVGLWANCLAYIPYSAIQGRGRPDVTARFHLVEVVPYLLLLWLALEWRGAEGAAIAWSIRVWADAVLLFVYARWRKVGVLAGGALGLAAGVAAVSLTSGLDWTGLGVRALVVALVVVWAVRTAPGPLRRAWSGVLRR